jgi:hypothetical protein
MARLDFFRRKPSQAKLTPIGVMGTAVYGGYIVTDEKNAQLAGQTRYRTYSDVLANTSIAAAGVRYFLNLISMADWRVDPADAPQGEELAEKVEICMNDMTTPWFRVIRRAAMYRFYGFSIQEWTAKPAGETNDGEPRSDRDFISYREIASRPQRTINRWDVDEAGKVYGCTQIKPNDQDEVYLPRRKLIYVTDDSLNDSPEGLGLFRHIVKPAQELARFEQLEGYGFETDLRGIPIGRAPLALLAEAVRNGQMSQEERALMENAMRDFITNHIRNPQLGILLDSIPYAGEDEAARPSNLRQWDIELLKAGNTSQEAVARAIERKNREIARVLGVEQLLLGEGSVGSHALAKDKSQSFSTVVDSTLLEISACLSQDFIDPLWLLNGWPSEAKPRLRAKAVALRDVLQVSQALKDMASAGAMIDPADPAVEEVRLLLGLSKPMVVRDSALEEQDDGTFVREPPPQPELPPGTPGDSAATGAGATSNPRDRKATAAQIGRPKAQPSNKPKTKE